MRQFAVICMLGALIANASLGDQAAAAGRSSLVAKGHALVTRMCANCHAIARNDASPLPAAPLLRHIDRQLDLDTFATRLQRGLFSGHQDMPMFRFSRDDALAVAAYVRSIQGP